MFAKKGLQVNGNALFSGLLRICKGLDVNLEDIVETVTDEGNKKEYEFII